MRREMLFRCYIMFLCNRNRLAVSSTHFYQATFIIYSRFITIFITKMRFDSGNFIFKKRANDFFNSPQKISFLPSRVLRMFLSVLICNFHRYKIFKLLCSKFKQFSRKKTVLAKFSNSTVLFYYQNTPNYSSVLILFLQYFSCNQNNGNGYTCR